MGKRNKELWNNQKTSKIELGSSYVQLIQVNEFNSPIKRHTMAGWGEIQPYYAAYKRRILA